MISGTELRPSRLQRCQWVRTLIGVEYACGMTEAGNRTRAERVIGITGIVVLLIGIAMAARPAPTAAQHTGDGSDYRAIWKITDTKNRYRATAVAVGPRQVIVNAHALYGFSRLEGSGLFLAGADGKETVDVIGPITISATFDLALLMTAQAMPRHLQVAHSNSLEPTNRLHMAGYPEGRFATMRASQGIALSTRATYHLPMERIVRGGFSGGAVLAPNNEIVGINKTSRSNTAGVIPGETVLEFLKGEIGVLCENRKLTPCLEKATRRTQALAHQGNADAQFQLGRSDRFVPGERELSLLMQAAEQGNPEAQSELAGIYRKGAPGFKKDLTKAAYWSEEAAKQGHGTEYRAMAFYYLHGEGVPRDISKAISWLNRAVKIGSADAEYDMGTLYRSGERIYEDLELARYWFLRAAERGHEAAAEALAGIGASDGD